MLTPIKPLHCSSISRVLLLFSFDSFCSLSSSKPNHKFKFYSVAPQILTETNRWSSSNRASHGFYSSLLQDCVYQKAIKPGKQIHARLLQMGFGYDPILATKLVNLYAIYCDSLPFARKLFDKIPKRNIFLWNVLIRGYAWNGPLEEALNLYYDLLKLGLKPDNFTLPFVLKACSGLTAVKAGEEIHEHAIMIGWASDIFVGAALIDMYAKCGIVGKSREVFDSMHKRDVVVWNSMIAAYGQNGYPLGALNLCREMAASGVRMVTVATLVTILSASASHGAMGMGREIHGHAWRHGFDGQDKVRTALIDMYAKCGLVRVARRLFDGLSEKRVISWNAMIAGYGMHGHACEAMAMFDEMKKSAAEPDHVTFVGVLSACSHGGMINEGQGIYDSMTRDYGIEPRVEHYTCMISLLGHSGRLQEATDLILGMPVKPDSGIWGALLSSCKLHNNVVLGELALEKLIELEPDDAGNYVLLSNLYAQTGNWEGVAKMRLLMKEKGLKKSIACSWIEFKGKVHAFLAGDISHPKSDEIYMELETLGGLMKQLGYVVDTGSVFHDVEDDEKSSMVCSHSERLAIGFGLISTGLGSSLLVTKNLSVCNDCHTWIKFVSKIAEREIVVRDVNRYHHFKDGSCSCGDYW
ncbi:hypothetical protein AMTRI_Chr01g112170 [Amborella trichopoda]